MKVLILSLWMVIAGQAFADSAKMRREQFQEQLEDKGLTGLVHGANPELGLFVFNYSNPKDFFDRYELTMIPGDTEVLSQLSKLNRGDKIKIFGTLGSQDTPQIHVYVKSFELIKPYKSVGLPAGTDQVNGVELGNPKIDSPSSHSSASIPEELKNGTNATVLVHRVAGGGEILVVEYKQMIVPVVVSKPALTKDLYRGDIIEIQYGVRSYPNRPTHIALDTSANVPLKVLQSIKELNEKILTFTGTLVLYPKSPVITRDVWALEETLPAGLMRTMTLVNFEGQNGEFPELEKIHQKLRRVWMENIESVQQSRNKWINTKIKIRATGKVTVISPTQANAQLHLTANQIEIVR